MSKKIRFLLLIGIIPAAYANAADPDGDTAKVYQAKEMIVTATRSEISVEDAPSPVQVIRGELIQELHVSNIAEVLHFTGGFDLKDYGTAGSVKNAKIRGLSTENVLFLLNGNPINNAQNGSVDLSLFSTAGIERIEICYGGASALYGGNALGGVVNVITGNASAEPHAAVNVEGGSFLQRRSSVEVKERISGVGIYSGIARETGRDFFPYSTTLPNGDNTVLYRNNADYQRWDFFFNGDYKFDNGPSLKTSVQYVDFKRGDPGSLDFPCTSRLNDEVLRISLDSYIETGKNFLLKLGGIFNRSNELYSDSLDYTYIVKDYSLHAQLELNIPELTRFIGGVEYYNASMKGNGYLMQFDAMWNPYMEPFAINPTRTQKSMFVSDETSFSGSGRWFDRASLFLTVRYDSYPEINKSAWSPKLGLNLRIYEPYDVRIRSSYGKNFRVPTLNDLYYPMYSNPNLTPETANVFDAGIISSIGSKNANTLQVTYFFIASRDKIAYGPEYVPYNLGRAENSGYEIKYDFHSPEGLMDAYMEFTFTETAKKDKESVNDDTYNKRLPYVPETAGKFGLSIEILFGRVHLDHTVTGLRYTDQSNKHSLPAYSVTDAGIEKKIPCSGIQLRVFCAVKNVFNTSYEAVKGYPMPGRSVKVGMGLNY